MNKKNSIKTMLIVLSILFLISACAREIPLQGPINRSATPGYSNSKVVIDITHVSLNPNKKQRSQFFAYQDLMAKNLNNIEGFLGYSRLFTELESWTMTIWKDEQSLELFLNSKIHMDTIYKTYMAMSDVRSSKIELPLKEAILSWDKAKKIVDSQHSS